MKTVQVAGEKYVKMSELVKAEDRIKALEKKELHLNKGYINSCISHALAMILVSIEAGSNETLIARDELMGNWDTDGHPQSEAMDRFRVYVDLVYQAAELATKRLMGKE